MCDVPSALQSLPHRSRHVGRLHSASVLSLCVAAQRRLECDKIPFAVCHFRLSNIGVRGESQMSVVDSDSVYASSRATGASSETLSHAPRKSRRIRDCTPSHWQRSRATATHDKTAAEPCRHPFMQMQRNTHDCPQHRAEHRRIRRERTPPNPTDAPAGMRADGNQNDDPEQTHTDKRTAVDSSRPSPIHKSNGDRRVYANSLYDYAALNTPT